jgi:serine/threonine protein kinase
MDKDTQRQRLDQPTQESTASNEVNVNLNQTTIQGPDANAKTNAFLKPGYVVAGRYKILFQIGRGGMGVVYKVEQPSLKAVHALKILDTSQATQTAFARFQIEAQASFHLNHRNLIRVYDLGLLEDEHPYFVMDYVEGLTLAELIKSRGKLPTEEALGIFLQVCDGIGYAHDHGVIHRDLKPGNIMLTVEPDGSTTVKIVDFGIAKFVESNESQDLTRTGEVFGSPLYMSPEQCMGLQIDPRSDIYACGCALFETLTGGPPFVSSTPLATMLKHQSESPSTLKEATLGEKFPESLEFVVAKLLAKQPGERYQSMMALKHDLLAVKGGRPLDDSSAIKTIRKTVPSKTVLAVAVAVIGCAVIAGLLALFFASKSKPTQPQVLAIPKIVPESVAPPRPSSNKIDDLSFKQSEYFAKIPLKDAKGGPWDLSFPGDMWLGTLIAHEKDGSTEKQAARGLAHFPHAAPLEFKVRLGASELAHLFRKFRADELITVTFVTEDPFVTDDVLLTLDHLTGLRGLILTNCEISDHGMSYIANLPSLIELELGATPVTGTGMTHMKWLKKLEIFQASHMKDLSVFISAIQNSKSIRVLKLGHNRFSTQDIEMLSRIPNLTALSLARTNVTDKDLARLVKLKHLAALDVAFCNITPAAIPYLEQMHSLRVLGITTNKWSAADRMRLDMELPLCRPPRPYD